MADDEPDVIDTEQSESRDLPSPQEDESAELQADTLSPNQLLNKAVDRGAGVDTMRELMDLQERFEKREAKRAYDRAMSKLRQNLPPIIKDNEVSYKDTHYEYETLSDVTSALSPVMANYGLSFRWRTGVDKSSDPWTIKVTCIIAHEDGHSEETGLEAPIDQTGSKNKIQGVGSAVTYLQRYTLKAAVGVAAAPDDDAQSADGISHSGNEQEDKDVHYCSEHPDQRTYQREDDESGDTWWSHTIGDSDEWCNEPPVSEVESDSGRGEADPTASGDRKEQSTQTQQKSSNTSTDQSGDAGTIENQGSLHKALEAWCRDNSLDYPDDVEDPQDEERENFKAYLNSLRDDLEIESMLDIPVKLAKKVVGSTSFELQYRKWLAGETQYENQCIEERIAELDDTVPF